MLIEVRYVTTGLIGPMSTNFLNLETEFCKILFQKMLFKAAMNIYNFVTMHICIMFCTQYLII